MLGSTQFAFETPNVIDEGDVPPSPPVRTSFTSPPESHGTDRDYHHDRESAARLLNDIQDLELTHSDKPKLPRSQRLPFRDFPSHSHSNGTNGKGSTNLHAAIANHNKPYDPYDDEDESPPHHSLPNSAEDARLHAHMLLQHERMVQSKPSSPLPPYTSTTLGTRMRPFAAPTSPRRQSKQSTRYNVQEMYWAMRDAVENFLVEYGPRRVACVLLMLILVVVVLIATVGRGGNSNHRSHDITNGSRAADPIRVESIRQVLIQRGVSSETDLTTPDTPQSLALEWISTTDVLQYDANNPRMIQRYILAVFFFTTGGRLHPDSSLWTKTTLQFLIDVDECAWNDVEAMPTYVTQSLVVGVSCNEHLQVTALFLPHHGLQGPLPSELAHLPSLQLLGLADNRLTGSFPSTFSNNLLDLLYVNFNNNSLTGTVPEFIGDWAELEVLGLERNQFTGPLPASLGTASRLKTVSLGHNLLTGSLDFATHLSKLQYFHASHNHFTGNIDELFFSLLADLRELDVSHNELSGPMPLRVVLSEHELHILDASHNNFTGTIPDIVTNNFALHYLNLRGNKMTGSLPVSLKKLSKLQHLDVAYNQLSGAISNEGLPGCTSLTYLSISGNAFDMSGDALPPLSQLTKLRQLSLSGIGLTGPIPWWLQYVKELELLDLSKNSLTGVIPDKVWELSKLESLLLHDNNLKGPLPVGGHQFHVLAVHHNDIIDSNFDTAVCDVNLTSAMDVSADCNTGCTNRCCEACCKDENDVSCESETMRHYMDGLNYTAAALSFDPDILDEAGVFLSSLDLDESDP